MKQIVLVFLSALFITSCAKQKEVINREADFNFDWKFSLEQEEDASAFELVDSSWATVNLPHDWSVDFPFDSINGEGCTGYLPGGLGWYRKHFNIELDSTKNTYILFDGVYNNSEVWLNGVKLGQHPYGYSPFYFDLTSNLKNGNNVIAVKVDRTRYADSRWYSGSGIYRNVKLVTVNKLHIPIWGTFITTPEVSAEQAKVDLALTVSNTTNAVAHFDVVTEIRNAEGKVVSTIESKNLVIAVGDTTISSSSVVNKPSLWSVDTPNLYTAVTEIRQGNVVVDSYSTTFGIRSIRFDAETGFYLNEVNMKIKGVCLHHDGGLVGAAVPKAVWKRRLEILKEGGCNAIRISHNPASEEFLQLCDELGFLVQDEFFDEWDYPKDKRKNMQEQSVDYITRGYGEHFQKWNHFDLRNTMLAHRNHPSVFQWSIGNEIEWTYPQNAKATGFFGNMDWSGNYFWSQPPFSKEKIKEEFLKQPRTEYMIGETAKKLADWTRELDTTRPVIANCILPSASFVSGYTDALDIVGFSYRRVMYDYARKNYPSKIVMGTENLGQYHEWKAIEERPFVSGTFLWTGIDYMGESNARWPQKATPSGLLDQAGFAKPSYHMYKTLWSSKPHIYMCSLPAEDSKYVVNEAGDVVEKNPGAWETALWVWYDVNEHWNYSEGQPVIVEVISNAEEVELFLNDKSLGVKKLSSFPDRIYKWAVPFNAGLLVAKAKVGGVDVEAKIVTCGEATGVKLTVEKTTLTADGYDAVHVIAQLVDAKGNPVVGQDKVINFKVEGVVKSLGVDNGYAKSTQTFKSNSVKTYFGRAMIIVQSTRTAGDASVSVSGDKLESSTLKLTVK